MKKDFFGRIKKPICVSKPSQVIKPILKVKEDPKPCVKENLPCWSDYTCPAPVISPPWIAPRQKPKPLPQKKPEPEPVPIPEPIPEPEPVPEPTPRDNKMKLFLARLKK